MTIKFTTIQAANQDFIVAEISAYVGQRLGRKTEFIGGIVWRERESQLDAGKIQVGWICGLPYVKKADQEQNTIRLLAAPVMRGERYGGRPVYFSDVIVHQDSAIHNFSELRGKAWAYNEPNSHSGYNITRYQLALLGEKEGYFGKIVAAGSHQNALALILKRKIDASALDSTVLELAIVADPSIEGRLRVIEIWGPSPIPPWTIHKSVSADLRNAIREVLLQMHHDVEGRAILAHGLMSRFVMVDDAHYDPIREMARLAETVDLV
ncbi:MAG: PhnD/SsuA/transferrin family substrate-binding protein [Chloroflexi bacterium]|nr:PhnD/SsuA/transferrin family substrate-binding protein [Chloroflexota bacterium]